jgi:acetyl-CoA synthetase
MSGAALLSDKTFFRSLFAIAGPIMLQNLASSLVNMLATVLIGRLGTAEIESALVSHPMVTEAAAIGLPHEMKGTGIHTYVLLKAGASGDKHLESELKEHVERELGRIATPETVHFVEALPKTRSGKIMRRVLRARALGQDEGDLSTLEE